MPMIISLASRTYRTGMTLPEEIESYIHYKELVQAIVDHLQEATTLEEKSELLGELETHADAELKRYLRMKSNATFLF